jgi:hypothetical protein
MDQKQRQRNATGITDGVVCNVSEMQNAQKIIEKRARQAKQTVSTTTLHA